MGTPGRLPKPPAQRARRNKTTTRATLVAAPARRIDLPPRDDGRPWHRLTQNWWEIIWSSPMADEWTDADLPTLFRIAKLDHEFWLADDPSKAGYLANIINSLSRNFGLDPMSRRTLQWEIKRAEAPKAQRESAPPDPRLRAVS